MTTSQADLRTTPSGARGLEIPFDVGTMMASGGNECPAWPVSVAQLSELQSSWRRGLMTAIKKADDGLMQDSLLLAFGPLLSATIPFAQAAQLLQAAARNGQTVVGGPPEIDYLRDGRNGAGAVPVGTTAHIKAIPKARHPNARTILSTWQYNGWPRSVRALLRPQGRLVGHNPLVIDYAEKQGRPLMFRDAGTLFQDCLQNASANGTFDHRPATEHLAGCLTDAAAIAEPYGSPLARLVHAKADKILLRTFSDMSRLRNAALPDELWGNTGGQYAARAIAIELRRRGGRTVFGSHAGTAAMVDMDDALALRELSVSSTFLLPTPRLAGQEEIQQARELMRPLHAGDVIGGGGDRTIAELPRSAGPRRGNRPRVMYVTTPVRGFESNGVKPQADPVYLDWQLRLARFLAELPIELVCKPHPAGYFRGRAHPIEQIAPTSYERFENLLTSTDVFIFDNCTTTTLWEAVCTDRPVIYFDMGLFRFHRMIEPVFRRRCQVVPVDYDEFNRPHFTPAQASDAILAAARGDPDEFRALLIGDADNLASR